MEFGSNSYVANDNSPIDRMGEFQRRNEDVTLQAGSTANTIQMDISGLKPGQMSWRPSHTSNSIETNKYTPRHPKVKRSKTYSTLLFWIEAILLTGFLGSFAGLIASFNVAASVESQIYFTASVVALGILSIAVLKLPVILREWMAFTLLAVPLIFSYGVLNFSLVSLSIPAAILGIGIGFIGRAKIPLFVAGSSLIGLAYSAAPFQPDTISISAFEGSILTGLIFALLGVASQRSSRAVMALALFALFIWGAIWLLKSDLSQQAVAAFIFIIGAAQYKLGEAGLDENAFASLAFITVGWFLGVIGFLWLQAGYLDSDYSRLMSVGDRPASSMTWIIGVACALACVLVAGMSRHAHSRQTALSIFLTTVALGAVPFLVFRPDLIMPYLSKIPGLPFTPTVGLVLGGCGLVVFGGQVLKGMRLNRVGYSLLGLSALGAQIVMLYRPQFLNVDSLVILTATLVASGSFYALTVRNKRGRISNT